MEQEEMYDDKNDDDDDDTGKFEVVLKIMKLLFI